MNNTLEQRECPHCGDTFAQMIYDAHVDTCPEHQSSPFAATDLCPMCGQPYQDYMDHLGDCDPPN